MLQVQSFSSPKCKLLGMYYLFKKTIFKEGATVEKALLANLASESEHCRQGLPHITAESSRELEFLQVPFCAETSLGVLEGSTRPFCFDWDSPG